MKLRNVLIAVIFIIVIAIFLTPDKENLTVPVTLNEDKEKRAIFISYIEYGTYLKGKDVSLQKENIDNMITNLNNNNFNMIILHVRPFSDAIYYSKIFPYSKTISSVEGKINDFDILDYFISQSHRNNIEVHAWINPYRIRSTNNYNDISKDNPAYKWIEEKSNNVEIKNGIYYNPASDEVLSLIISGVEELLINYDIDGIHYDDYFYPSKTIDLVNYDNYKENGGTLSLKEYRYQNINKLLEETYKVIKKNKPNVLFGISPAGNIENNKNTEFLDIEYILENTQYLDYVMPQIYFGFYNSNKPYIDTVNVWNDLIKNKKTKLYVALAPYKIGVVDTYAGSGKNEWISETDILAKQIVIARTKSNYEGFSLFRYEHVFNEDKFKDNSVQEISNMLNLFNAF